MGNCTSCTRGMTPPSIKKKNSNKAAARVILPNGEIKLFSDKHVTAAEIMFECPGFFVSDARNLHARKRFSVLRADDELNLGSIYAMFPMKRLNSVVTVADVAVFLLAAKPLSWRREDSAATTRDSPKTDTRDSRRSVSLDEPGGRLMELEREYKYRLSVCRSRKPLLETIKEDAVYSR